MRSYARLTAFITELIAPDAAHTAPTPPTTSATTSAFPFWSFCSPSMKWMTPCGATEERNDCSWSYSPSTPSRPSRNATAGKNASIAEYETSCASPMQSSFMNDAPARLTAATYSPRESFSGARGAFPFALNRGRRSTSGRRAASRRLRARDVRGTAASRRCRRRRQTLPRRRPLRRAVASPSACRRCPSPRRAPRATSRPSRLGLRARSRARRGSARVFSSRASALQRLLGQLRLADRLLGHRRRPLLDPPETEQSEDAGDHEQQDGGEEQREPRREERVECRRDRQEDEAEADEPEDRGADGHADPDAEHHHLLLQLERGELDLEPRDRRRMLGDGLRRAADAAVLLRNGGGHALSSRSSSQRYSRRRRRRRSRATGSCRRASSPSPFSASAAAAPTVRAGRSPAARPSAAHPSRARPSVTASACAGTADPRRVPRRPSP